MYFYESLVSYYILTKDNQTVYGHQCFNSNTPISKQDIDEMGKRIRATLISKGFNVDSFPTIISITRLYIPFWKQIIGFFYNLFRI